MATWGAQYVSEKDLFVDEVSGFGSGHIQQQLLGFPQVKRSTLTSQLFIDLIEEMSPRLARLGSPEGSPLGHRLYNATPVPRLLRTLRPGWGG